MTSRFLSDGSMVRNRENPAVITGSGIYIDKKNFDFNLFLKYVSSFENIRFAPKDAGPQPLGNFLVTDVNCGYTLKGRMPLRLYIRIHNLTDKKYSTVVGYPDFGRMMYLGMRFNFVKRSGA